MVPDKQLEPMMFTAVIKNADERMSQERKKTMETIILRDEYIKLGQALKAAGLVESGVEAKEVIQEGLVMVNGETDTRRGRKLYGGDIVLFDGEEIRIEG